MEVEERKDHWEKKEEREKNVGGQDCQNARESNKRQKHTEGKKKLREPKKDGRVVRK